MAFLDAPDIDSVVQPNREMAAQLLAAADLWLFVTTASRYADAVPWSYLRRARERSTALAMVLNRVPPEALQEVPDHLQEMLRREGLGGTPVLTVAEVQLDDDRIPASAASSSSHCLTGSSAGAGIRSSSSCTSATVSTGVPPRPSRRSIS